MPCVEASSSGQRGHLLGGYSLFLSPSDAAQQSIDFVGAFLQR